MSQESLEEKERKKKRKKQENPHKTLKFLGKDAESSLNTGLEFPLYFLCIILAPDLQLKINLSYIEDKFF